MSFKAYDEYKDSGVEWLGEVPAHWSLKKFKHTARIKNGRDYKDVEVSSDGYPVIGSGGEFSRASHYLYAKESVLLGRKGTIDKPIYINTPFWTVDTMFYTEIRKETSAKYLYYYAKCFQYDMYSTNTALPSMAQEDLNNIHLASPMLKEQTTIAAFLDHETARIDALIEEQQCLIALLKEKRQAVISHAVTKGLDPNVPMKDSGVEWLGEVPAHWEVGRLKNASDFISSGPRGWSELIEDKGDSVFLQSGDLNNQLGLKLHSAKKITAPIGRESQRSQCRSGDIFICITGANTARVAYVEKLTSNTYINQHLSLIRVQQERYNSPYLAYILSSNSCQHYFDLSQYGLKEGLNLTNVAECPIAMPPREEQVAIVAHIEKKTSKIDELTESSYLTVSYLNERRSALISAAVTGKIDVRDWQPPKANQTATEPAEASA